MISAAFPPTGGPGVQRTLKFAKYLPQFCWNPIVWTVERMDGLPQDATLLDELPPEVERLSPKIRPSPTQAVRWILGEGLGGPKSAGRYSGLWSRATSPWLGRGGFPDDYGWWALGSLSHLREYLQKNPVDAIYSTFSPASNHWLAMLVKESTGLPWIADFRDLWVDDCRYKTRSREQRREHEQLQCRILTSADVVVGVSEQQTEILSRSVPQEVHKFLTVTNGYDPEDFEAVKAIRRAPDERFVLAHVGRFDKARTPAGLFQGLREFADRIGAAKDKVELRIIGHASADTLERLKTTEWPFQFRPYVSHREAIEEMVAADALLLPLPMGRNAETVIAAKLFEYLAAKRPILVVGPPDGACERIVRDSHAGIGVQPDATAIADALWKIVDDWLVERPFRGCSERQLIPFQRTTLAGELADQLDQLVRRDPSELRNKNSGGVAAIRSPFRATSPTLGAARVTLPWAMMRSASPLNKPERA
ncbi:MAG: glycosyltransferase [Planctomycetota bacterium]